MIETRIAARYLWMARKRLHTVVLSLISVLGLAIGVGALLISIALLSGLQGNIKSKMMASSPQILIEPAGKNTIDDHDSIVAEARRLGMRDVRPLVSGIGWGANEPERRGRPMRIRSITDATATGEGEVLLTRGFAAAIGLQAGDEVTVVAPRTRLTPFGPMPVWRKYRVAPLRQLSGDDNADAYLATDEAAGLFGTEGKPTSIEMYGHAERAEEIQAALSQRFPRVQVKTWKEINRPLFLALRLEKVVMFATISLIIFVAALNLISSLAMVIMEKRPQIGVLRTLGATEKTILSVFLQVGLLTGLAGTLIGNVLGIGFSWAADRYGLIPVPPDAYGITHIPFRLDATDIIGVNLVAIALSIVATWYPARIASRLDPINAIRGE